MRDPVRWKAVYGGSGLQGGVTQKTSGGNLTRRPNFLTSLSQTDAH
jgi:hypothetical protein